MRRWLPAATILAGLLHGCLSDSPAIKPAPDSPLPEPSQEKVTPVPTDSANPVPTSIGCRIPDKIQQQDCKTHLSEGAIYVSKLSECSWEKPVEASQCSEFGAEKKTPDAKKDSYPYVYDSCGCEGKTCAEGSLCVLSTKNVGSAGGTLPTRNQCLKVCASSGDCGADEICLPPIPRYYSVPTCIKAECTREEDCSKSGSCSHCIIPTYYLTQAFSHAPKPARCVGASE